MAGSGEGRSRTGASAFRLGTATLLMFLTAGFVVPGVWSAIRGDQLALSWVGKTWGGWILFWMGVSAGTHILTAAVLRMISHKAAGE